MEKQTNVVLTINYTAEDLHKLVVELSNLLSRLESGLKCPMVREQREIFMETLTQLEG